MEKREEILIKFGKHLEKLRKQRKLSIRQLAYSSDLEYSQVQRIEKGKVNLALSTLIALSEGLEIKPQQLLDF
jgi:transcriptional regulator with XRE-family HTH domain